MVQGMGNKRDKGQGGPAGFSDRWGALARRERMGKWLDSGAVNEDQESRKSSSQWRVMGALKDLLEEQPCTCGEI